MPSGRGLNVVLWFLQWFMGLFLLGASGLPKILLPAEALAANMPYAIPQGILWLIGVAEIAGGLGLILPGLLRIRPGLTPLAAAGLTIVALGASVSWIAVGVGFNASFAFGVAAICAFIAYGRWRLVPVSRHASA
jgi:hypothetical protein